MNLSDDISQGLKPLGNSSAINDECFMKLLDMCVSVILESEETRRLSQLGNVKLDVLKAAYASLLSVLIEAARHNVDSEVLSSMLAQDHNFSLSRAEKLVKCYVENRTKLQASLSHIGKHPPHIVDANWTLDYCIKVGIKLDRSYCRARESNKGVAYGGSCIYTRNDIDSTFLSEFNLYAVENVFKITVVHLTTRKIPYFASIDLATKRASEYFSFLENLEITLNRISNHSFETIVVCGDFNIDFLGESHKEEQFLSDSSLDHVGKLQYLIQIQAETCDESMDFKKITKKIKFVCTVEELQDFVSKLKDAVKHVERLAVV